MDEIKVNVAKVVTVPATATRLTITHEWGNVMADAVTVIAGNPYSFTPDSIGVYKYAWSIGTADAFKKDFYQGFAPVIASSDFFADNEDLEEFDEEFDKVEKLVRHIIQNYTGQRFGPYINKSMEIAGDGGDSLYLPVRIGKLVSVKNDFTDDISDLCVVNPNEPTLIQMAPRFSDTRFFEVKRDIMWRSFELFNEHTVFTILGDWGWEYVPSEVVEAAKLLIYQGLGGGDEIFDMRSRGVFRTELGDFKLFLNQDQWGSTGNNRADNLLAAHVQLGIGLV